MNRSRMSRGLRALGVGAAAVVGMAVVAGCSSSSTAAKPAATAPAAPHYQGKLVLEPAGGPAGTVVTATGTGLPANQAVDVTWQQVTGGWKVANGVFAGSSYTEKYIPVASATTDGSGTLKASFKVPEGFGYTHNVRVSHAGTDLNQAAFKIPLTAAISPKSGPVGTRISVSMTGIGFKLYHQNYVLTYDNVMTGWLSAVTTQGTAQATIPATGAPGVHYLSFYETGDRTPYLNLDQSPTSAAPTYTLPFTVTAGDPVLPPTPEAQTPAAVDAPAHNVASSGPQVWMNRISGPPGTPLTIQGSGFPAGQPLQLNWDTLQGSNIMGVEHVNKDVPVAGTVDSTGSFELKIAVPSDLQGDHKITVKAGSGSATTTFAINPSALALKPTSGPAGTMMTIHLLGTGSSFTSNIYAVDYDNAYIGFACGFNTQGDITMHIPATGAPGWHFIDLYPSIWKLAGAIDPGGSDYIQMPQLTYAVDHPVEHLPAFEYAFYVTP